jgi:hypothetical protein
MISDIYRIEGKYPDPHQIRTELEKARGTKEFKEMLEEVKRIGLKDHSLLGEFFVES